MKKYKDGVLLKAFNDFLEDDIKRAEEAGYEITTADNSYDDNLYMTISTDYEDLPSLSVDVNKRFDGSYVFAVDVEFPDLSINGKDDLADYLSAWQPIAKFVDDLVSVQFSPEYWID